MFRLFSGVIAFVCACVAFSAFSLASGENRQRAAEPSDAPVNVHDLTPSQVRAVLSNFATLEGIAATAVLEHRGGAISCYDITITLAEEPVSGLTAVIRMRGSDLDFDGRIRVDAGGYAIYPGVDEIEQCTLTVLRNGVVETISSPVINGAFVNAPYFYCNWLVGSGSVDAWDTGAPEGVFLVGGAELGSVPNGTYVNTITAESVNFPSHAVAFAPCACSPQECDPSAVELEVEPDCGLPADTVNGGCNSDPFVATPIVLGQKVCGTAAQASGVRDTDFYELVLPAATTIVCRGRAGYELFMAVLPADVCTALDIIQFAGAAPCVEAKFTVALGAGTYYLFAAPEFGPDLPCGSRYQLSVARYCPGDVTGDGRTNALDFNILAGNFAHAVPPNTGGDLDGNGFVNALDFNLMAGNFACLPY